MLAERVAAKDILIVRKLLTEGADPNGGLPLHIACRADSLDLIEILLSYGADPDILDETGDTIVHVLVKRGAMHTLERVLIGGASTEVRDRNGRTGVLLAASNGLRDVCDLLISHGADTKACDAEGHDAAFVLHARILTKRVMNDAGGARIHPRDLRSLFDMYDENGNGFLDREELLAMYTYEQKYYGVPVSKRQVDDFVTKCCGTEERIPFETFCRVWVSVGTW